MSKNMFFGNVENMVITQGNGQSVVINHGKGNTTVVSGGKGKDNTGSAVYIDGNAILALPIRNGIVTGLSSMNEKMLRAYNQILSLIYKNNESFLSLVFVDNKLYGMTNNSVILRDKLYPLPNWYHPVMDSFNYTILGEDIFITNATNSTLSYLDASSVSNGWVEISQWDLGCMHKDPLSHVLEIDVQYGKVEVYKKKSKVTIAV